MFLSLFKSPKKHNVKTKREIIEAAEARIARGNMHAQLGKVIRAEEIAKRREAVLSADI